MNNALIFDVGCNDGADSDFYLSKGFTVVAVEANPSLCTKLKRRFSRQIQDGRFWLVEKAIAEQAGEVEFFVNTEASTLSSIKRSVANRVASREASIERTVVPAIQFSSLIEQFGMPYYLKIDIEGADLLCIDALLPFRERPRFTSIESEQGSWRALRTEINLLAKLGYTKFQIVDQKTVPRQEPPNPPREGIYINHQFSLGASGLFGRELPGLWLSRGEVLTQYSKIYLLNKLLGLSKRTPVIKDLAIDFSGTWYNTHATM